MHGPRRAEALVKELIAKKVEVLAELVGTGAGAQVVTTLGDGPRPTVDRCPGCAELDFTRSRAGGTWRCARCFPLSEGTAAEWWPKVGEQVDFTAIFGGAHERDDGPEPRNSRCYVCLSEKFWRLKPAGIWICRRCHPPIVAAAEIECWPSRPDNMARQPLAEAAGGGA